MKWLAAGILALTSVFVVEANYMLTQKQRRQDTESVLVYPSITVTVNKSVVLRLPKRRAE